jgi:hypothetical protein
MKDQWNVNKFYSSVVGFKSRRMRWGDMWHAWERNVYRVLIGKPEEKSPLAGPRRGWEDWIRKGLKEIGWGV